MSFINFYAIPCTIQEVPISKSVDWGSDPVYLIIYSMYTNCSSRKCYFCINLLISDIHQWNDFDWFSQSHSWHWCMSPSLKCVTCVTLHTINSKSLIFIIQFSGSQFCSESAVGFVSPEVRNMLNDLWALKCQNMQMYNTVFTVICNQSPDLVLISRVPWGGTCDISLQHNTHHKSQHRYSLCCALLTIVANH